MLQLLKNNNPFTVLILLIFTFLVKMQVLLHPQLPVPVVNSYLYNTLLSGISFLMQGNAFAFTLLAVFMVFGQAIYLNRIASSHKLFYRPTYIPAFVFLSVTSLTSSFNFFSQALVINWFLLWAVDIMLHFNQTVNPRKFLFNAGFVLAIAALLQFTYVGFFLLLLVFMITLRPFTLGEWVVATLGYITPFYFYAGILFLIDKTAVLKEFPHIGLSLPAHIQSVIYFSGAVGGIFILLAAGIYGMQLQLPKSSIYIRRSWVALINYLAIAIILSLLMPYNVAGSWLLPMPALSLVISHALNMEKNKRFSNFIFYFSLLLVVFCQVAITF